MTKRIEFVEVNVSTKTSTSKVQATQHSLAPEALHTWEFNRDALLIRAYLWLWMADESKIDFCKLFWGTVGAPLAIVPRLLLIPGAPVVKKLQASAVEKEKRRVAKLVEWRASDEYKQLTIEKRERDKLKEAKAQAKVDAKAAKKAAKLERGPNPAQRALSATATTVDRGVAVLQEHERAVKRTSYALATAVMLGGLATIAWALTLVSSHVWRDVGGIALYGAGFTAIVSVLGGVMFFVAAGVIGATRWQSLGRGLGRGGAKIGGGFGWGKSKVGSGFGHGLQGFKLVGLFLRDGHHSVKYRTCPKVIIRK